MVGQASSFVHIFVNGEWFSKEYGLCQLGTVDLPCTYFSGNDMVHAQIQLADSRMG